jgi:hypothetical protein
MSIFKHCVPMSVDREEIVESHPDYVVIMEWLKPDPNGPYLVMSNHDEPTWAARRFERPADSASADMTDKS